MPPSCPSSSRSWICCTPERFSFQQALKPETPPPTTTTSSQALAGATLAARVAAERRRCPCAGDDGLAIRPETRNTRSRLAQLKGRALPARSRRRKLRRVRSVILPLPISPEPSRRTALSPSVRIVCAGVCVRVCVCVCVERRARGPYELSWDIPIFALSSASESFALTELPLARALLISSSTEVAASPISP